MISQQDFDVPGDGPTPHARLAALLRGTRRIQITNRYSATHVVPASLFYDHRLDTGRPPEGLCPDFHNALYRGDDLTACFETGCRNAGQRIVCPSGFWGFRHVIGMPQSISGPNGKDGPLEAPIELVVGESPVLTMAVSTDPNFRLRAEHEARLKALHPKLTWHYADDREEVLQVLEEVDPHIVYFYCHGAVEHNVAVLYVGAPGEYPIPGDVLCDVRWSTHPLVFINGSGTSALGPQTPLNLVTSFVGLARAAGVVGTEVPIFEPLACQFGEELLRRLLVDGERLGEAIRAIRLSLLQRGNPLGLVYVPFVAADFRLVEQRPSSRSPRHSGLCPADRPNVSSACADGRYRQRRDAARGLPS